MQLWYWIINIHDEWSLKAVMGGRRSLKGDIVQLMCRIMSFCSFFLFLLFLFKDLGITEVSVDPHLLCLTLCLYGWLSLKARQHFWVSSPRTVRGHRVKHSVLKRYGQSCCSLYNIQSRVQSQKQNLFFWIYQPKCCESHNQVL